MDLCSEKDILTLLRRHGFRFSRSLGQNFLTAAWVPRRIAEASGADASRGVLEIGPGVGCLTRELAALAGRVAAVELDSRLIPVLAETLADCPNVTVVPGDIMKLDLRRLTEEQFPGLAPMVCANLPYNITSPVLTRLIESCLFSSLTVMIQREVALRLCAEPGTADYGAFGVFVNYHCVPELLFDVPPACFTPAPKVTSTVVRLTARPAPAVAVRDEKLFFRVVRGAFLQRRKTLVNALASALSLPKGTVADAVAACGLGATVRGETLSLAEFAALTDELVRRAEE